jgi:hypothetical protein
MSNQRKAEFVSGNFSIQSFWGRSLQNFGQNPDLVQKVQSVRILIQQTDRVSDSHN